MTRARILMAAVAAVLMPTSTEQTRRFSAAKALLVTYFGGRTSTGHESRTFAPRWISVGHRSILAALGLTRLNLPLSASGALQRHWPSM